MNNEHEEIDWSEPDPQPVQALQALRRPVITVRAPTMPVRSKAGGLMGLIKPDGRHYNRSVLAAGAVLALFLMMGVLVMRAVNRMGATAPSTVKEETIEDALSRNKNKLAGRKEMPLTAGGPPSSSITTRSVASAAPVSPYPAVAAVSAAPAPVMGAPSPRTYTAQPTRRSGGMPPALASSIATPVSTQSSQAFSSAWSKFAAARLAPTDVKEGEQANAQPTPAPVNEARRASAPARGTTIPLTLLEPLSTGIPGFVRARVREDVRDAGGALLIPKGSVASLPFLSVEVRGRIPLDRSTAGFITLPSGEEMPLRGAVKGPDGLPGLAGKVSKAKGGPSIFGRIGRGAARIIGRAAATETGGLLSSSDISDASGVVDPYAGLGSPGNQRSVDVPAGTTFIFIVGL